MIQKHDRSDRRFLTFPAVYPCSSISPATLLDSLITLSRNICDYQSKFFATHRKIIRETVRQTGILLIFFEEIQECGANLSASVVLCFSELHVALQKVLFLLQDCTRSDARLWVLMRANFVATQFRVLIRTIATALDVLPLCTINVSSEIKEIIEMVAKQARKSNLELDSDDETAMNRVILILNQFENKFEPGRSYIKHVLDYLVIKSWSECQSEIKFLDEEIGIEYLDGYGRDLLLLSSLIGFMSYCRVLLFETGDFGTFDQTDGVCTLETITCLNLEDFRCPISLEMMTDPVTVSTGQTYDRSSIQKWLQGGNLLCPKTGEILKDTELVPNSTLRKLIQQFCEDNGTSLSKSRKKNGDITRTIVAGSPSAAEAIKFVSEFISNRLYFGTDGQKKKAAYEIRLLAKSNIFNRFCLIESGTVPPLLNLLHSTTDPSVQEYSISALLKLSKHSSGKKAIIENGGLQPILRVLKKGLKLENRQISAATIFYLSSVHEYRKLIAAASGAIPALVDLIKDGTNWGKKNAVVAIFGLLLHHSNHQRVLSSGIVPILVDVLASSKIEDLISDSLAVLSTLAESVEGSVAILQKSPLPLLTRILQTSISGGQREYCVSILLSLCTNCGVDVISSLTRDPSVMPVLYSLTTDGTSHARKKARSLIRILHKFQETSSSELTTRAVPQERFIHVR